MVRFIDEQMAAQRRHCLLRLWFALSGDAGGRNDDVRPLEQFTNFACRPGLVLEHADGRMERRTRQD